MSELITLTDQQTLQELEAAKATIQERMALIDADVASVKCQLDAARATQLATGQYADSQWWAHANATLKHNGRTRQELQTALGEVSRRIRTENHKRNSETAFKLLRESARDVLPAPMFELVMTEFQSRIVA